jgi:sec-independent protein translocase protein TatA
MPNLGPMELIIILVIVVIVFGVGRLPEVGGAVGRAIREFRQASSGEDTKSAELPPPPTEDKPK